MHYTYHFFGMDLIWWIVWSIIIILFFFFFTPVLKKDAKTTPLDILQRRFSNGKISVDEYERRKKILERDLLSELRVYFLSPPQ